MKYLKSLTVIFILLLLLCCNADTKIIQPTSVLFSVHEMTLDLAKGEQGIIEGQVFPEGVSQKLNWYSSDTTMLTVKDGVVTPLRRGNGSVRANVPGISAIMDICYITIIDSRVPSEILVSQSSVNIEPGYSVKIDASAKEEEADQSVSWKSSNQGVATVDENGVITAKGFGKCTVCAASVRDNNVYADIAVNVCYGSRPEEIAITAGYKAEIGSTEEIEYSVYPNDASQIVSFSTSDANVATIKNGVINYTGYGKCTGVVYSTAYPDVKTEFDIYVTDARVPDRIICYPSQIELEPSQSKTIEPVFFPDGIEAEVTFTSSNWGVAKVDENGVVTATGEGSAVIRVASKYTNKVYCDVPINVKYGQELTAVTAVASEIKLYYGDTFPSAIILTPEDGSRAITVDIADDTIVSVDDSFNITAKRKGETDIIFTYYKNKTKYAKIHVTVEDETYPESIKEDEDAALVLEVGDKLNYNPTFEPKIADRTIIWETSKPSVVKINDDGIPEAVASGIADLTATSLKNPDLQIKLRITVKSDTCCLIMPERRTTTDEIDENLAKIENVRQSAEDSLARLVRDGIIEQAEYDRRLEIVNAAFEMYSFAWMVQFEQKYWNKENSEDGAKDFKPGVVYYGMPYTSGINDAHMYTFARALKNERYLAVEGEKYYLYNQTVKDYRYGYVGCDCSAFVSLAIWNNAFYYGESIKTGTLYYDERLAKIEDASTLRAGDIMVRHSSHVVMFLYWADEAHTQAVFIEQGGSEPAINTVSTSVYELSYYTENHYRIRRLLEFRRD